MTCTGSQKFRPWLPILNNNPKAFLLLHQNYRQASVKNPSSATYPVALANPVLRDKNIQATQIKWGHLKKVLRNEPENSYSLVLFQHPRNHRPEGSLGRGNWNCKQWQSGLRHSSTNPEGELPDPCGGESRILAWAPEYPVQTRADRPQTLVLCGRGLLGSSLGAHYRPPQTTSLTETPDPELTQLAREKTPSTAPMVTQVMAAADQEVSSAVVTASWSVSSWTPGFLRPETHG